MRLALAVFLTLISLRPSTGGPAPAAQPATLHGRVVAADEPTLPERPLPRARLTLIAAGQTSPAVFADDAGAFALEVPASDYTVRVTKSGYAPVDIARAPAGA